MKRLLALSLVAGVLVAGGAAAGEQGAALAEKYIPWHWDAVDELGCLIVPGEEVEDDDRA